MGEGSMPEGVADEFREEFAAGTKAGAGRVVLRGILGMLAFSDGSDAKLSACSASARSITGEVTLEELPETGVAGAAFLSTVNGVGVTDGIGRQSGGALEDAGDEGVA